MINEKQSLYNNILLNPHDNGARLIYADYLEENNEEELAKFIRLSIELETKTCYAFMYSCYEHDNVCSCDKKEYYRYKELLKKFSEYHLITNKFSCGFLSEIKITYSDFIKDSKSIVFIHPIKKWVVEGVTHKNFIIWSSDSDYVSYSDIECGIIHSQLFNYLKGGKFLNSFLNTSGRRYICERDINEDLEQAYYNYAREKLVSKFGHKNV